MHTICLSLNSNKINLKIKHNLGKLNLKNLLYHHNLSISLNSLQINTMRNSKKVIFLGLQVKIMMTMRPLRQSLNKK